jgi:V/A-type H+/Na+-transporting ATPase subunit D
MAEPVPPGRAGRSWLRQRVAFAERSLELLSRKQALLRHELAELSARHEAARLAWDASCAEADRWGLRADASGASDVRLASSAVAGQAAVDVSWRNTMGVRHPAEPRIVPAVLPAAEAAAANAAVAPAAGLYRQALEAAAAHAALDRSVRVVAAELRATERRRRAIEHRRLPSLRESLERLELRLDELERDERVATRWAAQRRESRTAARRPLGVESRTPR